MSTALFPPVSVDGVNISSAAIAAEAQNHPAPKGKPGLAWRRAARALTIRQVLLAEAQRRGIVASPQGVGPGRKETGDEAQIRALLDEALVVAKPDEAAVQAEWQKSQDKFRAPPLWEVSHILFACDPGDEAGAAKARERAVALLAVVQSDHSRFPTLAASDSDCGSKSNGGALGQLGPGDTVPEFEAALRQLSEGEISQEPVRTRFGWHIIRMDARAEGRVLPYEIVRPKLAEAMEKAAWTKAAQTFVDGLVANSDIIGADIHSF